MSFNPPGVAFCCLVLSVRPGVPGRCFQSSRFTLRFQQFPHHGRRLPKLPRQLQHLALLSSAKLLVAHELRQTFCTQPQVWTLSAVLLLPSCATKCCLASMAGMGPSLLQQEQTCASCPSKIWARECLLPLLQGQEALASALPP